MTSIFYLKLHNSYTQGNEFKSLLRGREAGPNPWEANTLEWSTESPPGHGNFDREVRVYRGPYEYASPLVEEDYLPQTRNID